MTHWHRACAAIFTASCALPALGQAGRRCDHECLAYECSGRSVIAQQVLIARMRDESIASAASSAKTALLNQPRPVNAAVIDRLSRHYAAVAYKRPRLDAQQILSAASDVHRLCMQNPDLYIGKEFITKP